MKQPDLYYFETMQITSQVWSKDSLRLVFFIQNLTRLVTSFLWFQNSIDQAFHRITVKHLSFYPTL